MYWQLCCTFQKHLTYHRQCLSQTLPVDAPKVDDKSPFEEVGAFDSMIFGRSNSKQGE